MKKTLCTLLAFALAAALLLGLTACFDSSRDKPMTSPESTLEQTTTVPAVTDPNFDYMGLFERLEGYWNTEIEEERYTLRWFVCFHYNEYNDAKPSLYCGAWESECSDTGELVGGRSTGENTAELAFLFPAITGDGELPMHPELTAVVSLDFSALDSDGEIAIKINNYSVLGNGAWHTYTYGGKTMQEAAASSAQTLAPASKSAQTQPKQSAAPPSTQAQPRQSAASTSTTASPSKTRPAITMSREIEQDGLVLKVFTGYQHQFTGEPFILTATITNTTGHDITYGAGSGTRNVHQEIQVRIPGFTDLDIEGKVWIENYRTATLKAGETFTETIRFSPNALPAGEYEGTALFVYYTGPVDMGETERLELKFPVILF